MKDNKKRFYKWQTKKKKDKGKCEHIVKRVRGVEDKGCGNSQGALNITWEWLRAVSLDLQSRNCVWPT